MASFFLFVSCFEEERRLDIDEKPLVVQLNWNKDDREGRFVLKNENDAVAPKVGAGADASPATLLRLGTSSSLASHPELLSRLPQKVLGSSQHPPASPPCR